MSEDVDESQKTEDPTPKRLEEAREKGQVINSKEVGYFASIFAAALIIFNMGPWAMSLIKTALTPFLSNAHDFIADGNNPVTLAVDITYHIGWVLALIFGLLLAVAIGTNIAQSGWVASTEKLQPKLSNISLKTGIKRLVSVQNLVEFLKGIVKISVVGIGLYIALRPEFEKMEVFANLTPLMLLDEMRRISLKIFLVVLCFMAVLAAIDYVFQRYEYLKNLKMTKQEVKDETKSAEGDPQIKQKLRQIRVSKAKERMMKNMDSASVVITNPTHYAVALKYHHEEMEAPVLVAKGVDFLALRLREMAAKKDIPIYENPPLARALYAQVDIDQEVPIEFYESVAQVIRYVMEVDKSKVGM